MWQKFKALCLEKILQAEILLPNETGAAKRKQVVEWLDGLITLPWPLEALDGYAIGFIVDGIVQGLNWLTGYMFNADTAKVLAAKSPTAVLAATEASVASAASLTSSETDVDARIDELVREYGLDSASDGESGAKASGASSASTATVSASASAGDDAFARAIAFTLKYEGGANFTVKNGKPVLKAYARNDAGGATIYGITWGTLKTACAQGIVPHNDICKLTLAEAKAIYKRNYWDRYNWGELAWPVSLCCLDCCVNHGGFAWILQRALAARGHSVTIDGKFGPETFRALCAACENATALASAIINKRRDYFRAIVAKNASQSVYLKGWLARCDALAKECAG